MTTYPDHFYIKPLWGFHAVNTLDFKTQRRFLCQKYYLKLLNTKELNFGHFFFLEGDAPGLQAADLEASIATLQSLAETIDAECVELRRRNEQEGQVVEYLIRKRTDERDFMEVRYSIWN